MKTTKPVSRLQQMLAEMFGFGPVVSLGVLAFFGLVMLFAVFWFFHSAPPRTITITSGDEGTRFRRSAERYAKILERSGVTLKILPSEGSPERASTWVPVPSSPMARRLPLNCESVS